MKKHAYFILLLISAPLLYCASSAHEVRNTSAHMSSALDSVYPFLNLAADSVTGSEYLAPFFAKLLELEQNNNRIISIVHCGDSHIQADIMTEELRSLMQRQFGNAGRGLIFPHRTARSNEPYNFQSTTTGEWKQVSIVSRERVCEPGIATRSIFTTDTAAALSITLKNDYFQKMTVFAPKGEQFCDFSVESTSEELLSSQSPNNTFTFTKLCNNFTIKPIQRDSSAKEFRLYGICLQNDSTHGVLYHSMGSNGAHLQQYNNAPEFFAQLPQLHADIIIVSLGTNEGAARDITKEIVYNNAVQMITNIRREQPEISILLTTPTHNFYLKKYPNQRIKIVREGLLQAAADMHCGIIDLYTIGGGEGSCYKWKAQALLRADGVHYSGTGYRLQGNLIYNALLHSYAHYAH
ncbi:MAG: GDSL-type esterase/lipase family protein [Bacteroidales bacterium]|jgi:lysophospholipase L1-like esterase|nr:GDSL-type esterase/lipase family protein [Bacteroidales bacterium]